MLRIKSASLKRLLGPSYFKATLDECPFWISKVAKVVLRFRNVKPVNSNFERTPNFVRFILWIDLSFLFEDLCFHGSMVSAHIPNTLFDVE